ncbi:hypothetical protein HQQ80_21645 [Microbacteriaceae bacterium VKM Ac-2855]|nr:hypothetical protein [Microbacteriaceae bacterium VKM Ac-2855]
MLAVDAQPAVRRALLDEVIPVVAECPTFQYIEPDETNWDPNTMTADGLHPSDWGQYYLFQEASRRLMETPYSGGITSKLTYGQVYPAVYSSPTPPPIPSGGTNGASM